MNKSARNWIGTESFVSEALIGLLQGEQLPDKNLLEIYVNEAIFFWRYLRPLLLENQPFRALEVGSGIGLLSMIAASEIDSVTALEPGSSGFGKMHQFREKILGSLTDAKLPVFKDCFLHGLPESETFDFVYCINVLEHVPDPESLVSEIYERLNPGGLAWFILPNYAFPYEQHFGIPIVLNKEITGRMFRKKIANFSPSPDPIGLWQELSWPTQKRFLRFLKSTGWHHHFDKTVLSGYFDRLNDPLFIARKGLLYEALRPLLKFVKPVILKMPLSALPVVEFTVSKPVDSQSKTQFGR